MSCYHPIYAVNIGTKENGKADLKMLGYRPDDRETYVEWHNHRYPRDALVPCMLELGYHDSAFIKGTSAKNGWSNLYACMC